MSSAPTPSTPAAVPGFDWVAARQRRETELLASFDPTVPGLADDGGGLVLATDADRGLTYTWYNVSRRTQDFSCRERGYLVSRLSVTLTDAPGTEVGYLNLTSTTPELVTAQFPTPFHWAEENTGANFGFDWATRGDGPEVTQQKIWATAYTFLDFRPPSAAGKALWVFGPGDAPTDPAVLNGEIAAAAKDYKAQMRRFVRSLKVPFVDYSRVEETVTMPDGASVALRGTGIGRTMYLLAAQHLAATRGVPLRASGLQSDEAQRLWARLVADPEIPTRKMRHTHWLKPYEPRTFWCIDYTGTIPRNPA